MKFNLEMKFKKGDLVEVIEHDYFRGVNYLKGTCWVVDQHICKDTVRVVDESQPDGTALLGTHNLKKVEGGKLMNKQEIKEKIKENGAWCTECHTGEEGRYVEIGKAMELIGQLDEPQKPVVPKFVVPFIEKLKNTGLRYGVELEKAYGSALDEEISGWLWFNKNVLTLFRALDIGYVVEKEPLYTVELPSMTPSKLVFDEDYCKYKIVGDYTVGRLRHHLTEKEIKYFDERYWAFAVPVEEGEEGC